MSRRGSLLLVAVGVLLVAPVLLLGWMRLRAEDKLTELQPAPVAVVAEVIEVETDDAQGVLVELERGPQPIVSAPAWSGTITAIETASGTSLTTGDVVVTIDGVDRVAAATTFPFWRPLAVRSAGADVAQLQELLQMLGYYTGPVDGSYDSGLAAAVTDFGLKLGADPRGVFDPAWIVWLPFEAFGAENLAIKIGDAAPSQGTPIVFGRAELVHASVMSQEDGQALMLDGDWDLEISGNVFSVIDGQLGEGEKERLDQILDAAQTEIPGSIRRGNPERAIEVPATAVTSNPSGDTCVWVPNGSDFSARAIVIDGGGFGRVVIADGLEVGDSILVNPGEILGPRPCP